MKIPRIPRIWLLAGLCALQVLITGNTLQMSAGGERELLPPVYAVPIALFGIGFAMAEREKNVRVEPNWDLNKEYRITTPYFQGRMRNLKPETDWWNIQKALTVEWMIATEAKVGGDERISWRFRGTYYALKAIVSMIDAIALAALFSLATAALMIFVAGLNVQWREISDMVNSLGLGATFIGAILGGIAYGGLSYQNLLGKTARLYSPEGKDITEKYLTTPTGNGEAIIRFVKQEEKRTR